MTVEPAAARRAADEPGPDAVVGVPREDIVDETLQLCDEFFRCHASTAVHSELRAFLAARGHHPTAGLGAFLDTLSLARRDG
jgi:hypothetical protein